VATDVATDEMPVRVRALRERLGISQEQLAQQLGVSFATVNRWEAGHHRMSASARSRFDQLERTTGSASPVAAPTPEPLSLFVGRAAELAELVEAVRAHRLVSLTGPAGIGKTRLAIEVCRSVRTELPARFVVLSGVTDPQAANALITAALMGSPRLLVLDGVEHCIDTARTVIAGLPVAENGLRVLVTSQRSLGIAGEHVWPVAPLTCPPVEASPADVLDSEAGWLFADRASAVTPGFGLTLHNASTVAALCHQVEGLPAAVEILAGWTAMLSVEQIVERHADLLYPSLDDAGSAGLVDGLRDAVLTSYRLLGPSEQDVVRCLSVFAGSFTLADAAAVAQRSDTNLLTSLRRLVDCSWLVVEPGQPANSYRMSNTLRLLAKQQLAAGPDEREVRARHARHFADLAAASEPGLIGVDRMEWVARMTLASVDVDAALVWASDDSAYLLGLEMSAALWLWWLTTGRLSEGRHWVHDFLDRARDAPAGLAARAECAAAVLAVEGGDYAAAVEHAGRALGGFERLADTDGAARAATALGSAHRYLGEHDAARHYFELAMNFRRDLGDDRGLATALNNMALLALDGGDLVATRALFEEALLVKRRLGEPRTVAIGLANLSDVLIRAGLVGQALDSLREAAEIAADLADTQLLATIACNLGDAASLQGHHLEAVGHYQTSLDAYRASGGAHDLVPALCGMARALATLGRTHEAVVRLREAEVLSTVSANSEHMAEIRAALADLGHATTLELPGGLTDRQAQILRLVANGASNKSVAEALHISVATVERHLATIYSKLGLHGRVDAARYALKHGLAVAADGSTASPQRPEYMVPGIPN
jgi:non-specific serine/threonine protein kinase